jgi:uncharacterized membrane protein
MDCVFAEDARLRLAPIYYIVQYAWSLVAGGSLLSLRILSVLLSVLATLQIFALGRSIGGRSVGLWAAAFFSLSLFQVYYGQEVRFYSLMNVFALGALHALLLYLRRPGIGLLLLCAAANAALIWTHTFAVVFVLAQGLVLSGWWTRPRLVLPWFILHGLMALALFGWIAVLDYDFAGQSAAYRDMPAGPWELANTFLQFAGGRFSNMDPAPYMPLGFSADLWIAAAMAALAGLAVLRVLRPGRALSTTATASRSDIALLLIVGMASVLGLYALTWCWRPCFFSRYLIYAALPLYLLAAVGLTHIPQTMVRRVSAVVLVGLFAWQNLSLPRPFRADYGDVARAVSADPTPVRVVLALKPFNFDAVEYALRDQAVPVQLILGLKEMVGEAKARAKAGESVWAVFYRWDDLAGFIRPLEAAGAQVTHFQSAGMPPLDYVHVGLPGSTGPADHRAP